MEKAGGLLGIIVIVAIVIGLRSYKGNSYSKEYLWEAKAFIAQADKYNEHRETFDWLVETAHDEVFDDSYHGGGRRSRAWVDEEKYAEDLYNRMMELAKGNGYHEVAESIERLYDPDAAERQKQEKAAAKKKKK